MSVALQINGLTKKYGVITAINNLSLTINKGEIWGILGPNGSGKTTTLAIILDVIQATSGTYSWFEGKYDPHHRLKIGGILETPNFYPYLNAIDNLKIIQHIKNSHHDDLTELLQMVKLHSRALSKFHTYSLGMKQRLAIAATLIGDPDVLVFDEPTNGLDPMGIIEIRTTLLDIARTGKTIIMASHILDEVEKICEHVAILKQGQLISAGKVGTILTDQIILQIGALDLKQLSDLFQDDPFVTKISMQKSWVELITTHDDPAIYYNNKAHENGIVINHLVSHRPSLEEEFLSLVQ